MRRLRLLRITKGEIPLCRIRLEIYRMHLREREIKAWPMNLPLRNFKTF